MKTKTYSAAIAGVLSLAMAFVLVAVPAMGASQDRATDNSQASQQVKGGEGVVKNVDNKSGNCLSVRSGPADSEKEVACIPKGEKVQLSGVFSEDRRWAQLDDGGWVPFKRIRTDVHAPKAMKSGRGSSSSRDSWRGPAGAGSGERSFRRDPSEGQEQMNFWYFGYP
jgi:hypothetical protein